MYEKSSLIGVIAKKDKFSVFSRVMASSGANDVFKHDGPFTVFVPTNDAFGKIDDKVMEKLLNEAGQSKLKVSLSYHVLHGKVMAARMGSMESRKSVTGHDLYRHERHQSQRSGNSGPKN